MQHPSNSKRGPGTSRTSTCSAGILHADKLAGLGRAVPDHHTAANSDRLHPSVHLVRLVPRPTDFPSVALHGAMCGVSPFGAASRQHLSPSALLCTGAARGSHPSCYYYHDNADGTLTCIPRPPAYTTIDMGPAAHPCHFRVPCYFFAGPQVLAC